MTAERPLRVVVACDWFLKYAGAQAAGLAAAGAEVILLCRDHPYEFGSDVREQELEVSRAREAGVRVLELSGRLWDPRELSALARLRAELARFAPDVTHVHEGADPRYFAVLPRALRVLTIHDPTPHPGQDQLGRRVSRVVLEYPYRRWRGWAQLVVVHSGALAERLTVASGVRVAVIPHGIDVSPDPLTPPDRRAVGFFGRREPYKGLDVLAQAMPRVWEARPDVDLRVAGAGASELPLRDERVHELTGYLPETEVTGFLSTLSLVALPYTEASQSGVGSVAIGAGVPVVASRLGGLPDLVLDESYLATPGDAADLAAVILSHLDDGLAIRRRVIDELAAPRSWRGVGESALREYAQALSQRGRSVRGASGPAGESARPRFRRPL